MKIYEPVGRAREYSPLALNFFKGCDHGCKYCYVPPMMKRFSKNYDHRNVIFQNNYNELEKSILSLSPAQRQKQVLLSFTSDPYTSFESGQTRQILNILLKYDIHVAILTKNPQKAQRDIDIFKQFEHFKIGTTLTFYNEKKSKLWEPGAPTSQERIQALKIFAQSGLKTWASFEPVIEFNESLECLAKIVDFIDHVKIGKLNNYYSYDKNKDWAYFLEMAVKICREYNIRFYVKKDLAKFNENTYLSENELNQDYLNV